MGTNPLSIAILAVDEEEKKALAEKMKLFEGDFRFSSSISDLRDNLFENPCNGILFCIGSIVGLDQAGKGFIQTLELIYSTARLRWNKEKNTFAIVTARSGSAQTISDFFNICSSHTPRRLRKNERYAKTLNVIISSAPDLSNALRTYSINISLHGCYLATNQEWKVGDPVYIEIQEMPNKTVIEGIVIRYVPWGTPYRVQGIGIQFTGITKDQIKDLQKFLFFLPA
jgi:Tfp pilus assembly protein PilZ